MAAIRFAVINDARCDGHEGYFKLSEKPERLATLRSEFAASGYAFEDGELATAEELALAHDRAYIQDLERLCRPRLLGQLGDLAASCASPRLQWYLRPMAGTFLAARAAAGSSLKACRAVVDGRLDRALALARPPGHHAGIGRAEGFCFFGNAALCALYAKSRGLRAAIVDFDHHHGNGTEEIVEARGDGSVLLISSHWENCKYAKGASVRDPKHSLRIPLPTGADWSVIGPLWIDAARGRLRDFAPDLLIISAGFDMHEDDPLSSLRMRSSDYYELTRELLAAAAPSAGLRAVSILEGGYELEALGSSAAYHASALACGV